MAELFTKDYVLLWTLVLAAGLFFPVRRLVWILSVRRAERDGNEDEARRQALKKRAGATAALLCFVFAYFYVNATLGTAP